MSKDRIIIIIFIIAALLSWLNIQSYAEEDFSRIVKLVKVRDGKIEGSISNVKALEIRDTMGRDRTPEGGLNEGDEILLGRYVHCGSSINAALEISNNKIFWIGSDSSVEIRHDGIGILKGEVYTKGKDISLELADGNIIDLTGNEIYLKATKKETLLYLFNGKINMGTHILDKRNPSARISAGEVIRDMSDDYFQDVEYAKRWRKSIRNLTRPFWLKPKFYIPATSVLSVGIGAIIYYYSREPAPPEVSIVIKKPN